jgi:hypothetical protein
LRAWQSSFAGSEQQHSWQKVAVQGLCYRFLTWAVFRKLRLTRCLLLLCGCRSIDQLNRERKLQQQAAGAELRVLEDQYYSALRKNLEISAACQSIEEEMELLQAKIGRIEKKQQQEEEQQKQQEEEKQQEQQEQEQKGGEQQPEGGGGADEAAAAVPAAEEGPAANGVVDEEQQEKQAEQPAEQQPEAGEGPADMEQ